MKNTGSRATEGVIKSLDVLHALVNAKVVLAVHRTGIQIFKLLRREVFLGIICTDCGVAHVAEDEIRYFSKSRNPGKVDDVLCCI